MPLRANPGLCPGPTPADVANLIVAPDERCRTTAPDVLADHLAELRRVVYDPGVGEVAVPLLNALTASLVSDSLVFRYDSQSGPDGVRGEEHLLGVLVLVRRGAHLCWAPGGGAACVREMRTYANHLGLYAEQISRGDLGADANGCLRRPG